MESEQRDGAESIGWLISSILSQYGKARSEVAFSGGNDVQALFSSLKRRIEDSSPVQANGNLKVVAGYGKGNWATIPWLSILDGRETDSTQRGIYIVYLFSQTGEEVYLTIAQGVTELNSLTRKEVVRTLSERAGEMRSLIPELSLAGFKFDEGINLRSSHDKAKMYEASTIAYRRYGVEELPEDVNLIADLDAAIRSYDALVEIRQLNSIPTPAISGDRGSEKTSAAQSKPAPSNTILYGPPGTGKTYGVVDKALEILDPELLAAIKGQGAGARALLKQRFDALHEEGRIRFVTFHQSFAYEDFVEGLKARAGASGALEYGVENGVFLELCIDAQHSDLPYVLIIDEINRGNIARIFGELITLIEPSKRQGMDEALSVRLPYSKQDFAVPANLHIIGTMNTADRSLAAMDVALRRRFRFIEMPPQPELLDWDVDGIRVGELLSTLNNRIEVLLGRDHLIGHAYLMGVKDLPGLAEAFRLRILPLLQEYFFEDWRRIAWVLNDDAKPQGERFLRQRELQLNRLFAPEAQLAPDTANWYIHEAAFEQAASYRGILVGQAD
ncbi:TPA: McrB family protein [Stenotrophomonas maltophilia]